ncbi:NUMOD4 domain-containing protein [Pseudomonas putida]|uniref:NUMOD4 domain-containing protein n=1 Tax=Pseudomonas putida TaxID=303 RepID=UPI0018D96AF0|nr:hypothetical protein [Pseudomonas putida]
MHSKPNCHHAAASTDGGACPGDNPWRPVPGFKSTYLISSEGQVKSAAWGAGRVPERLLKQFADRGGYT